MIISEVLDAIDNVNSITLESEISMCESLLSSYDKMSIIEENYNGDDINDFKIFQEGFGDDVKDEMKKSGKNMGTLMKILTALPRFIIAIVKSIKNRLSKKTKNTAKEINDNVKKLSDEQKKGLAQLFPKDRKGKIDAKKIITGMIGGAAVAGAAIATAKFKIPKKLAEQTKHVLGKLKGKKSNNPKSPNKENNTKQNENINPIDNKLTDSVDDKELFDKAFEKLKEVIKISTDDIKIIMKEFSILDTLKSGDDGAYTTSDKFWRAIKNIKNENKNIDEKLSTEEGKRLQEKFSDKWKNYDTFPIDDKVDIIVGNILTVISCYVNKLDDEYEIESSEDTIEKCYDLYDEIDKKTREIGKTFNEYRDDAEKKISRSLFDLSTDYFGIYCFDENIYVFACILSRWLKNFVKAKYYLGHKTALDDYYKQYGEEEVKNLDKEIKKEFNIEKIYYETEFDTPIDIFVSEFNSYIEKTLDPSKINKQIDDIKKKCDSISKGNVEMITSYLKDAKNEILYISNIIIKINELITDLNDFIKKINETNGLNIVTTDKKLHEVRVSEIRDVE